MGSNNLLVRFWGVRGSHPVPGQSTLRYGGNTSCIEVRAKNHIIILDAGTGIVNLGARLLKEINGSESPFHITLLFSHTHYDHILGLPFFAPAYHPNCVLNLYGQKSISENLDQVIATTLHPQYNPVELEEMAAQININNINENQILVLAGNLKTPSIHPKNGNHKNSGNGVVIRMMRSYAHPKVGVLAFRIELNGKSVVYATDTEGYVGNDMRLIEFAKNTDLLIHDAQYDLEEYLDPGFPRQGFGHSTYEMAAEVAKAAGVKNLVLFHHDPSHGDEKVADMEAKTRQLFTSSMAASEGLEFSF
jgi:phosphoribosyl 1,2-cyclic phosphodiesterase